MSEIIRCINCGKPIVDDFAFCPHCGSCQAPRRGLQEHHEAGELPVKAPGQGAEAKAADEGFIGLSAVATPKSGAYSAANHKKMLGIWRDGALCCVALLLFILSFLGVITYKVDLGVENLSAEITLSAIDLIEISSGAHKSLDAEAMADSELSLEIEDLVTDLQEELTAINGSGPFRISKEAEKIMHDIVIKTSKLALMSGEVDGTDAEASAVTVATIAVLYIAFSGIMFVLSALSLLCRLNVLKNARLSRFVYARYAPLALGGLLALLLAAGVMTLDFFIIQSAVAAPMIAALTFACAACAGLVAVKLISAGKKGRKPYALRLATAALVLVAMGTFFAPAFSIKLNVQPTDRNYPIDSSQAMHLKDTLAFFRLDPMDPKYAILPQETLPEGAADEYVWFFKNANLNEYMKLLQEFTSRELRKGEAVPLLMPILSAAAGYRYEQGSASGFAAIFYAAIAAMVVFGVALGKLLSGKNAAALLIAAAILTLLCLGLLGASIGITNEALEYYEIAGIQMQVDAGVIVSALFSLMALGLCGFALKGRSRKIKKRAKAPANTGRSDAAQSAIRIQRKEN